MKKNGNEKHTQRERRKIVIQHHITELPKIYGKVKCKFNFLFSRREKKKISHERKIKFSCQFILCVYA